MNYGQKESLIRGSTMKHGNQKCSNVLQIHLFFAVIIKSLDRISVSTSASHALEPGSIPGPSSYNFFSTGR